MYSNFFMIFDKMRSSNIKYISLGKEVIMTNIFTSDQAIKAAEGDPSVIFELIRADNDELLNHMLEEDLIDVNLVTSNKDSLAIKLLKSFKYDLVLKVIKNKNWDINYQNEDKESFGHILAKINNVAVVPLFKELKKNKYFDINLRNKDNKTIFDISVENHNSYISTKIIEDERFNNIDIFEFLKFYETYMNTNEYGKYSKINMIDSILTMDGRYVSTRMQELLNHLKDNVKNIKKDIEKDDYNLLKSIIKECVYQYI